MPQIQNPESSTLLNSPPPLSTKESRWLPLSEFFGRAFGTVMTAAQAQGVPLAGPPFALYRGMPTETVDVEAGFPVKAGFSGTEGVANGTLPEAEAFEAVHLGPYDTLGTHHVGVLP